MKIIIVDDDQGILNALNVCLTSFGYKVIYEKEPVKALEEIEISNKKSEPIELILTDLKMPDIDGIELIRLARQLNPQIMAILMTAFGDDFVKEEINSLGGCGYIDKPFTSDGIVGIIEWMRSKGSV